MNEQKLVVAVDGPAGSGKSTISREVAGKLGLKYIDSGAVYRSITFYLLQRYCEDLKPKDYAGDLAGIKINQVFNNDGSCSTFLNGTDISEDIRETVVTKNIGVVSDDVGVRNYVNNILRNWAEESSVIMDGRDIGTVVFPNANIKIYLDASVEERAFRRLKEYKEKGKNVDIIDIKNQIALRDKQDMTRPFGRLVKANDAVYIDSTKMNIGEVVEAIIGLIRKLSQN